MKASTADGFEFGGLYGFHGHKCPMSTMGARLGLAAMSALGVGKADQFRVSCHYRAENCALDGIQYVTGCTLGNGNITHEDAGVVELVMGMRDGSRQATASASDIALARFKAHREYKAELAARKKGAAVVEAAALEAEERLAFEELTGWVQTAPDDELVRLGGA